MKPIFEGIATALVTPFNKKGIDYIALKKLIKFQIACGINALVVLGTTGEAPTISFAEKQQLVTFCVREINNAVPLIIGIGGNNPDEIIKFGKWLRMQNLEAQKTVIDGVLLSTPYYNKATQDGLYKFFAHITKQINLPTIVYNVPARTGINLEPSTCAKVCKLRNVRGVKEASASTSQIADVIRLCPKTAIYSGDDVTALSAYALGALGTISVASNIRPLETCEIYKLFKTRKTRQARELFLGETLFYKALFCEVNPIPVKYALYKMHMIKNVLRMPLTPLARENQNKIDELI